ncbi:MAG: hypothetical protein D6769_01040, partial [Methanobacteriota archaeon]
MARKAKKLVKAVALGTALAFSSISFNPLTERKARAEVVYGPNGVEEQVYGPQEEKKLRYLDSNNYCQVSMEHLRKKIGDQEINRLVKEAYKYVKVRHTKYHGEYVPTMFKYIKLNPRLFKEHGIKAIQGVDELKAMHEENSKKLQNGDLFDPPVWIDTDSYPAAMKIDLNNSREPSFKLNDTAKFLSYLVFNLDQKGGGCTTADYLVVNDEKQEVVPGFKYFKNAFLVPGYIVGIAPPGMVNRYSIVASLENENDSLLKGSDFSF